MWDAMSRASGAGSRAGRNFCPARSSCSAAREASTRRRAALAQPRSAASPTSPPSRSPSPRKTPAAGRSSPRPPAARRALCRGCSTTTRRSRTCRRETILKALATAGLFGAVIRANASISGAEVGCQGEIGSACSMAAAAGAQLLGGNAPADRVRGRDRHGASPRPDLRPGGGLRPDPLHRAQHDRVPARVRVRHRSPC